MEESIADLKPPSWQSWGGRILILLFAFWIINIVWLAQTAVWFIIGSGESDTVWSWMWATIIQVLFTAVPLLPLAWKWPIPRYRAVFQTWLLACLYPLLLAPTRLFIPTQSQTVYLLQILGSLLIVGILWHLARRPSSVGRQPSAVWLSIGTAVFVTLPWFAWGSLGSLLDILLSLLLGLLFGLVAAKVNNIWLHTLKDDSRGLGWDMLTGGLVLGTAVLILASGLSFNGGQLLTMLILPALGWAMMGAAITGQGKSVNANSYPAGLLVGLTAAIILMFTDTDGLFLTAFDGILRWSFQAAVVAIWPAWLVGFLMLLLRKRLVGAVGHGRLLPVLALVTIGLSTAVFLFAGQPGLYGDRLFVILNDQANVSSAASIEDYDQRRQFVYDALTGHAQTTQADLHQSLDRLGVAYTPYYLVNGIEVQGDGLLKLWLSTRPEVDRIIPSPVLRPVLEDLTLPAVNEPAPTRPQWNLTNIGADRVWNEFGVMGAGIIIGQSDSGVQWDHPELRDGYLGGEGEHDGFWLDPWRDTAVPEDLSGHGTHTLGSILGNSVGVAPDAEWYACANLYRNLGNPALYLDCMQFMLAPYGQDGDPFIDGRPTQSAHILNNSWGCPEDYEGCDPTSLQTAVAALRAAGIFVVASAGNEGPDCSTVAAPIAIYDEVFSVGAVDRNNNIAAFSSSGPVTADGSGRTKPDIAAPGVDVLSAVPGDGYASNSGTSMAGPHVVGVVALLWSANPALIGDIERTEEILRQTAIRYEVTAVPPSSDTGLAALEESVNQAANPTGDTCLAQTDVSVIPNNIAGYGIVNAYEAVKMALNR